jgi:hypothetical protein
VIYDRCTGSSARIKKLSKAKSCEMSATIVIEIDPSEASCPAKYSNAAAIFCGRGRVAVNAVEIAAAI